MGDNDSNQRTDINRCQEHYQNGALEVRWWWWLRQRRLWWWLWWWILVVCGILSETNVTLLASIYIAPMYIRVLMTVDLQIFITYTKGRSCESVCQQLLWFNYTPAKAKWPVGNHNASMHIEIIATAFNAASTIILLWRCFLWRQFLVAGQIWR